MVAVGGDGTLNEIAGPLVGTAVQLGIVPNGSGNGLARHLGISTNFSRALSIINDAHHMSIDCATANGRYFFCAAGIGFDSLVGKAFSKTKYRGLMGYIRIILKEYFGFKPLNFEIRTMGKSAQEKAFLKIE